MENRGAREKVRRYSSLAFSEGFEGAVTFYLDG